MAMAFDDSDEENEAAGAQKKEQIANGNMAENQDNNQILESIQKDTFHDRAYGCILGAFIGDACGSYLEFN